MTTLSVPVSQDLLDFINRMVESGEAETKAGVVRRALRKYAEDEMFKQILVSQKEIKEGKILRGDLREILKKIK